MDKEQRVIKFRAWDKKKRKMFDDEFFLTPDGGTYWNEDQNIADVDLMQFTGLKDKNGKEIYEGDLVKLVIDVGEVVWISGEGNIGEPDDQWGSAPGFALRSMGLKDEDGYDIYLDFGSDRIFEVIGNIYANPELLK